MRTEESTRNIYVTMKLNELKNTYQPGLYWNHDPNTPNNPDSLRTIPCSDHSTHNHNYYNLNGSCGCNAYSFVTDGESYSAIQCHGFALYMGAKVFGEAPPVGGTPSQADNHEFSRGWVLHKTGLSSLELKPGDIIRTNSGHSAIVHYITNSVVHVGEVHGSNKCVIHWGLFNGTNDENESTTSYILAAAKYVISSPDTVTVSFDIGYSSSSAETISPMTVNIGGTYGNLPQPTRSGYTFAGWWPERDQETREYTSNTIVNQTSPHTLYAHWAKKYLIKVSNAQRFLRVPTNLTSLSNGVSVSASAFNVGTAYQWYISDIAGKKLIRSVVDPAYGLNNTCEEDCCGCNIYKTAGNEKNAVTTYHVDNDGVMIQWNNYTGHYLSAGSNGTVCWATNGNATYQHWELMEIS